MTNIRNPQVNFADYKHRRSNFNETQLYRTFRFKNGAIDYYDTGFDSNEGVKNLVNEVQGFFVNYTIFTTYNDPYSELEHMIKWQVL